MPSDTTRLRLERMEARKPQRITVPKPDGSTEEIVRYPDGTTYRIDAFGTYHKIGGVPK